MKKKNKQKNKKKLKINSSGPAAFPSLLSNSSQDVEKSYVDNLYSPDSFIDQTWITLISFDIGSRPLSLTSLTKATIITGKLIYKMF